MFHDQRMSQRTSPINLDERRAARRENLPNALSAEQLRRRAVTKLRHNLAHLAEDQFEEVQRQLELVAVTDGPKAYVELYLKMLEFAVPKLSRAEVSVEDGGKTHVAEMSIEDLQALVREGAAAKQAEERTIDGDYSDLTGDADSG